MLFLVLLKPSFKRLKNKTQVFFAPEGDLSAAEVSAFAKENGVAAALEMYSDITDPAIVAEFEKVLAQCVEDPSFKETCDSLFLEITYMDSAEMTEALKKMVDDCQKMYEIMNG